MRPNLRALLLAVGPVVMTDGCTFTDLADYEIRECRPSASYATDECASLNADPSTCMPFQCDAGTRRCVRKPRDDDHDGDIAAACSGGDCDDTNAAVSSLRVGPPSSLAGATLPVDVTKVGLSSDGGEAPTFAFASKVSGGECLSVAKADVGATTALGSCQLLGKNTGTLPTQIETRRVGDGAFAAAFVSLSGCGPGALAFAYGENFAVQPCGGGAARPGLAMLDSSSAAIAWYAAPAASRASALDNCATAASAPLRIQRIPSIAEPTLSGTYVTLTDFATSLAAPAMVMRGDVLFVASPSGDRVSLWALDRDLKSLATQSLVDLVDARSASIAARRLDNGRYRLAVVAETGCEKQTIRATVTEFDPSTATFAEVANAEVAASGTGFQWLPTVAWVPTRDRWLVSWFTTGPKPMARFLGADLAAAAPGFELTTRALATEALSSGHIALVGSGAGGDQLLDSPARCP
jgi:hypothetical protein